MSTGVGCHFLLQGIFPIQGLNPGLPHCRQTLLPSEPHLPFYQNLNPASEEAILYFQHRVLCLAHRRCIGFVFAFYCFVPNYHFSVLNQHSFISSKLRNDPAGQASWHRIAGSYNPFRALEAKIKVSTRLSSCMEALEKDSLLNLLRLFTKSGSMRLKD